MRKTLFEKIWDRHIVLQEPGSPAILYIELHLVHEVTSPQAFSGLRQRGLRVRRPEKTIATMDHSRPTTTLDLPLFDDMARRQLQQLLIKFRSMRADNATEGRQFEPGQKSRVTRLGEVLRRTKLDELPELFNVLLGNMSIVGPRPEVEKYVGVYPEDFRVVLKVRPGLYDYASIKYRNEEEILAKVSDPERYYVEEILPDKLRMGKEYVAEISFKTDMRIIAKTIWTIFQNKGTV